MTMRRRFQIPPIVLLAALLTACDPVPVPPSGETAVPVSPSGEAVLAGAASGRTAARAAVAGGGLGDGFVVWESNRSGTWRIWTRPLDGGAARQLTTNEPGRHHYAPHISPDGAAMVYLKSSFGGRKYPDGGITGDLHLLSLPDGEERLLVDGARTYFENRSVVWRSATELVYIGEDFRTYLLDVESGETSRLTVAPAEGLGYLIDAPLRHASSNSATFSVYDRERRRVVPRANTGGCQPYFSHDGRWGVWAAGAGGPIQKMDLDSRRVEKLIDKNDSRLPDGWGYLYFPMPSRDGSLFAVAASRNEHDHFKSDYEIFVFESDPDTLQPIGDPVRYTHDPATDRYPDVYRRPLALGRHRGEAPFELELTAPDGESWRWSFGDEAGGEAADAESEGASARHRYERPGHYAVEARRGGSTIEGQVLVAPGRPPEVVASRLSGDARRVVVEFDEPVLTEQVALALESGRKISSWRATTDGRGLEADLEVPLEGADRLVLSGVADRALSPHRMKETLLKIGPPQWPASREGLVFAWQTGDAPNLVPDPESGEERAVTLGRSGTAILDHHWAMLPGAGRFEADAEDAARVRRAVQSTNEMSLELTLRPGATGNRVGVVSFASGRRMNFWLELRGRTLVYHRREGGRGPNLAVELFEIAGGRRSHVVVTYSPARLTAYLNGEKRLDLGAERIRGDYFHWRDLPLTFGGGQSGALRLEGVAIYARVLDAGEVESQFERYRLQSAGRPEVPVVTVEARLVGRTPAPRLEQISPYREALVVYEYEVVRRLSGELEADRLRVAHWSILDGERLALNDRTVGGVHRLRLEPFDANPQLASLYLGQADTIAAELPLLYAPSPVD